MAGEWDGVERRKTPRRQADKDLNEYLHKLSRRLTIVIVCASIVIIWMYIQNRHRSQQGQEAHTALCVFKEDLRKRMLFAEDFLKDNPNGIPGIRASVLRTSIANQKATLKSLATLSCAPLTEEGTP